ncbi:MAG: hypothetical protein CL477_02285 [Acidobacteria bacterium]|jgi:hypothetical protein|nr:hypothetical protein [Acidobacteriota bacterium]MDP7337827.1 hypothetical protein [Vicinamibacterales bacterium]MDP7480597.1 hypothetical protein [Vicinamibacterales bacterium]HJN42902.1 hypothetical protein [Vicinamibacterales bacterium]|tara:strand:- start:23 stop:256 length:234 start_codon:yes stop_codon:yes gene_type:complete
MRIGRLIKYAGIAAVSGTVGFLIGAGQLPDSLRGAPRELATKAEALYQEETTVTGALNFVRNRVSDGVRRVTGFLDD